MEMIKIERMKRKPNLVINYEGKRASAYDSVTVKISRHLADRIGGAWKLYDFFDRSWRVENGVKSFFNIYCANELGEDVKAITIYFKFVREIDGRFTGGKKPSKTMQESARLAKDIYQDRTLAEINRELEAIEKAMNERLSSLDKDARLKQYSSRSEWSFDEREAWEGLEMTDGFNKRGILLGKAEALEAQIKELREQKNSILEQARVIEAHAMRKQAEQENADFNPEDLDTVFRGIAKYDPSPFVWG